MLAAFTCCEWWTVEKKTPAGLAPGRRSSQKEFWVNGEGTTTRIHLRPRTLQTADMKAPPPAEPGNAHFNRGTFGVTTWNQPRRALPNTLRGLVVPRLESRTVNKLRPPPDVGSSSLLDPGATQWAIGTIVILASKVRHTSRPGDRQTFSSRAFGLTSQSTRTPRRRRVAPAAGRPLARFVRRQSSRTIEQWIDERSSAPLPVASLFSRRR